MVSSVEMRCQAVDNDNPIHISCTLATTLGTALQWASCQIRKIADAHAPRILGTFSPAPRVSDPDMQYGTCVTHVPWCMPVSLTSGLLWIWPRGKLSRHSRCMRNLQFYVSGKRRIADKLPGNVRHGPGMRLNWWRWQNMEFSFVYFSHSLPRLYH